ncbi:methyltransferase domain-containing protein [Kitasatospora aburaviensis]
MKSRDWDERYAASELVWGVEPNRWVVRELAELAPGRALDLAAGEGRNSIWLARRGWHVTGLDFSAVALERAERLTADLPDEVADRLTWRHGDARELEAPPEGYDLVLVAYLQLPPRTAGPPWCGPPPRSPPAAPCWWSPTTAPTSPRASAVRRTRASSTPRTTCSPTSTVPGCTRSGPSGSTGRWAAVATDRPPPGAPGRRRRYRRAAADGGDRRPGAAGVHRLRIRRQPGRAHARRVRRAA